MDEDTATRFVSSLVKSIQALCNGYIDFSSSIEVVGHIHLNIDRNKKLDYVLTEEVSKSVSEGATVFASHSYHSHPPPSASSKTSGDASNQNRRKSQVSRDNDPLSITSLPPEVPNTSRSHSSSRVEENSDSSGSANYSQDFTPVKSENNRTSCQVQESLDRRRKGVPLSHTHRTQSPAAKRPRNHDTSSAVQNPGFDVIEIKEEPDDEPSVYFGDNSSSNMAAGQDIQTPDFSNVVMESLDRVGQIEGTQLVAGGDSGQQHQPFPVMLHTNPGMPSSSSQGPGPSLNPQSTASTSGVGLGHTDNDYLSALLDVGPLRQQRQVSYQPGFMFNDTNRFRGGGKNRNPQSSFWRNMSEERRALEREKSRLRMQMSRARRKEQEQYFADNNRQTLDQNSRVFMYGDVLGVGEQLLHRGWNSFESSSFPQHCVGQQRQPSQLPLPHPRLFSSWGSQCLGSSSAWTREQRRLQKQSYRARLSEDKKLQVNQKERERYARKKALKYGSRNLGQDFSFIGNY